MARIAYLGPEGTFTEAALLQMADRGMIPRPGAIEPVAADGAAAALQQVRDGEADYACVPIENSIDGSVLPTLDSLAGGTPLRLFAELTLDVAFSIAVRPGASAAEVRTVAAFPVAAAQVRKWLAEHLPAAAVLPANSNAAAAVDVAGGTGRRRGDHRAGRAALRPDRVGRRHRRRTERPHAVRAGRAARTSARRAPAPTAPRWCCGSTTARARWWRR